MGPADFQGSAVEVQRCLPKMGSFPWKFVEFKEQIGFVLAILPRPGPVVEANAPIPA
jgi:hypothetical protein